MVITSPHNEKLKLVHRLGRRRSREREGLFVGEGEDLLAAARAAGADPVELLTAAGEGLGGTEVEPSLLAGLDPRLGDAGDRIWRQRWATSPVTPCVYLQGSRIRATWARSSGPPSALIGGSVALGPDCADPFGPRAVRASMGAVFAEPLVRAGVEETPQPRVGLVAHGGDSLDRLEGRRRSASAQSARGCPGR